MPKDVGVVLLSLGVAGLAIPGPIPPGTPFLIAGVVFTCPALVRKFGGRFRGRFPTLYSLVDDQAKRFQSTTRETARKSTKNEIP